MHATKLWQVSIILPVLSLLLQTPALAQFNGSVRGVVTDPSDAPVPNANVTLKNVNTDISSSTKSDGNGEYVFTSLAPGEYSIEVTAAGFHPFKLSATVQTSQTLDAPIKLALPSASQTVEVSGAAPILDTADNRVQTTLTNSDLTALPLQGRTLFGMMGVAPGVTGTGNLSGGIPDNFQVEITNNYSANGRPFDANLYIVDGLDITSSVRPGVMNLSPNPDSVQETSVQTDTYSVEYGRASSIVTAMTTKSGTNRFHGVLSDYFTSQQLWARTEFTNKYQPFHDDNFGAAIGGPIIKDHTFFFVSLEPLRSLASTSGSTTFEAPQFVQWAQQNFPSAIGTTLMTQYPISGAVSAPVVQKTAQSVLGGTCGTAATFNIPCSLPMIDSGNYNYAAYHDGTQWSSRLDQYFRNDRIYGNFYNMVLSQLNPSVRSGMTSDTHYHSQSLQVNETHTFSSTMLNEASFGYLEMEGLVNETGPFHVPDISITGQSAGLGVADPHEDYKQHNFHWRDVFSLIRHSHTLKFGVEGFHGDELTLFGQWYSVPSLAFSSPLAFVQGQPTTESQIYYNPLTGQPNLFTLGVANTTWGGFAQDEWKIKPHLTVTLGLRFDDFGNTHPSKALGSVIDNFILGSESTQAQQVQSGQLEQTNHILARTPTGFTPRVGVAWDPTGKGVWSVRGGFGVYHDWLTNGELSVPLRPNPPTYAQPTFRNGTTQAPIFSLGTSDLFPFGYTLPALPASSLDSHGGIVGEQLSIGGTDPHINEPTIYNYSVGVQRQIGQRFVVAANYAGNQSPNLVLGNVTTLTANYDINRYAGDLISNNNVLHRLLPSFGAINYTKNGNKSGYNAFIATVTGRLGSRDHFQVSYTRSHVHDYGYQFPDANVPPSNFEGPSSFNVPNRLSVTENLGLPLLTHVNPVLRIIAGSWQLSGTLIAESGMPFTVYTSAAFLPVITNGSVIGLATGSGDFNGDGYNYDWPNIPSAGYAQPHSRQAFLTGLFPASAFGVPQLGTEGNEQRGRYTGPNLFEWDSSINKTFPIAERLKIQLRFEFYNIINHPNLNGVVSDLSSSSFGKSTSTLIPRYLQIAAKVEF
ncbi:MAG TPA: TonB-dependent receptor [Bryobacteraceae bacterium]|nr:TonB-dependent receptor [Bryobacteraceae bacterium]